MTVTRYSVKRKVDGRHPLEQGNNERDSETFLLQPGDGFYSPVGFHHYFQGVNDSDPLFGIAGMI